MAKRGWGAALALFGATLVGGCSHFGATGTPPDDGEIEPRVDLVPRFSGRLYSDLLVETRGGAGSDFDVDVSADGAWIAFSSTRHSALPKVYIQEVAGGGAIEKTRGPHRDIQPKFSPDGKWLAYSSDREGNFDIWVIAAAHASPPWQLTSSPADEIHPTWSPDGRSVAYCRRERDGAWFLWVIDVESQKRRRLGPGLYPEWSPDGRFLAFQRPSERDPGYHGVWIVEVTGGAPREIATEERWGCIQPSWAPNSRGLVYGTARVPAGDPAGAPRADDLWIVTLDGHRMQITEDPAPDYAPVWGLNGRIYFTTERDGTPRLVSILPAQNIWTELPR